MSPEDGAIQWDRDEFVGTALIDRPARRNALSAALCDEIRSNLEANRDLRAVVVSGTGDRAFCSGADLAQRAGDIGGIAHGGGDSFRPAFDRWVADDPLHNPNAIPSPLREKNYVLANAVKADKLEALGDVRFEQGKEATEHADDYVFVTVFFAVVLFFAGISLRFAWMPMRLLILGLGALLLVYATIRIGTLPTL